MLQAFSAWYFSWTSGVSVLCVMFQVIIIIIIIII